MRDLNPAVTAWIKSANADIEKWSAEKRGFSAKSAYFDFDWHPDFPPQLPFHWTLDLALSEVRHRFSGIPASQQLEAVIADAATRFMGDANTCLTDWAAFMAGVRQQWHRRKAEKAARRVPARKLTALDAAVDDVLRPPAAEWTPSARDEAIAEHGARKHQRCTR